MTHRRLLKSLPKIALLIGLIWPAFTLASAGRPQPPSGIYAVVPAPDDPAPAPVTDLMPDTRIYNQLVAEQRQDDIIRSLTKAGAGAKARGGLSNDQRAISPPPKSALEYGESVCLNFDDTSRWNGNVSYATYARWGTFSVDDGGLYRPENVRFEMEESVGSVYSFKIAGDRPYAAGLISPVISARTGALVEVRVKYLIAAHDGMRVGGNVISDWVSLGLKPDAHGPSAQYVNGYNRGDWGQMVNSLTAGESGEVLVMLQAESPAAFNSNVYFDDLEIFIDGVPLADCS